MARTKQFGRDRKRPTPLTVSAISNDKLELMRKWQRRRWRVRLVLATAIIVVNAIVTRNQPGGLWSTFFLTGALAAILGLMRLYEVLKEKARSSRPETTR